jgi:glutamate-ammonia-ligase adenylyltransferase
MIEQYLNALPDQFQPDLAASWEDFSRVAPEEDLKLYREAEVLESLVKVWASSRFIIDACKREPTLLGDLIRSGDLYCATGSANYLERLQATAPQDEAELRRVLRVFRRREMVRIAWRDIAGWSELSETLMDVSLLAETSVQFALDFAYAEACERNGPPLGKDGKPLQMVVLGMGKLGAWELNYSSDIDLIFAMPEEGYFNNRKQTSYSEFFTKVGRKLIQALDNVTVDGFVFRVDMRLRPWGDSGALVLSFDAIEKYYREHGREWERYAMVKARAIAGDMQKAEILQSRLRPFVYRSYLDYGVFAELRELKQQIIDQQQRRDKMDNIKLGPGGIRDIEFITQVFQLIRGGRDTALQDRRLQHILVKLAEDELLPTRSVEELLSAYKFLRVVEHRLQQYEDKQTNDLPSAETDLARLAFSLDFPDWDSMSKRLAATRQTVKGIFEQVFSAPQLQELPPQAEDIWSAESSQRNAILQNLVELGYADGEQACDVIASFRSSMVLARLGEKGSKAINQLMPLTISAAVDTPAPVATLERVIGFFTRVAQRSMYLSLLLEHPLALTELLQLAARSPWIVEHISREPLLLDELLNPNKLYEPLIKSELTSELQHQLRAVDIADIEAQILELQHFQQVYVLRVAAADITGAIPLITVSDYLSDIAEVLLEAAVSLAWRAACGRYELPAGDVAALSGFGVVARGVLGAREMSYDTPLDIEFIYSGDESQQAGVQHARVGGVNFYKSVASRVYLLLTSRTVSGVMYQLHARATESGGPELLIYNLEAYLGRPISLLERARYVQARFLCGDPDLTGEFNSFRRSLLSSGMEVSQFSREIIALDDQRGTAQTSELFPLDHGVGGLRDIHWIVACGVMARSVEHPELLEDVETMSLLYGLVSVELLTMDEYRALQRAYMKYREKLHILDLQHARHLIPLQDVAELQRGVSQVFSRVFSD